MHEAFEASARLAWWPERVLALVPKDTATVAGDEVSLTGKTWAENVGACPGQPYLDQLAPGLCTAVLVTPTLAVTAAHCVSALPCDAMAVVRDYSFAAPGELRRLSAQRDLRFCERVVKEDIEAGAPPPALAWIVLTSELLTTGAEIGASSPMPGQPVVAFAHNGGSPLKFLDDAAVVEMDATGTQFTTNLDAFHGASGAPVVNTSGALLGILVTGGQDFYPTDGGCMLINVADGRAGEEVVISYAAAHDRLSNSHSAHDGGAVPNDEGCTLTRPPPGGQRATPVLLGLMCLLACRRSRMLRAFRLAPRAATPSLYSAASSARRTRSSVVTAPRACAGSN